MSILCQADNRESKYCSGELLEEAEIVAVEEADIVDAVFEHGDARSGSSRDWAAKGTRLLGVRAVVAESFERIHRSNLIGMGILALQFKGGTSRKTLGLTGTEI